MNHPLTIIKPWHLFFLCNKKTPFPANHPKHLLINESHLNHQGGLRCAEHQDVVIFLHDLDSKHPLIALSWDFYQLFQVSTPRMALKNPKPKLDFLSGGGSGGSKKRMSLRCHKIWSFLCFCSWLVINVRILPSQTQWKRLFLGKLSRIGSITSQSIFTINASSNGDTSPGGQQSQRVCRAEGCYIQPGNKWGKANHTWTLNKKLSLSPPGKSLIFSGASYIISIFSGCKAG